MKFGECRIVGEVVGVEDEGLRDRRSAMPSGFKKHGTRPVGRSFLHDCDLLGRLAVRVEIRRGNQAIERRQLMLFTDGEQPFRAAM
jgi:hypothetical protein